MLRAISLLGLFSLVAPIGMLAQADQAEALALATMIAERPANEGRAATMHFQLENGSGRVRNRTALMVHSDRDSNERIAIFFTEPAMIEETAFLSFNYSNRDDENWLYLPATERVRRLPMSDRGDYFMGTDLSYGDVKDNFKFTLDDWSFDLDGTEAHNGEVYPVLTGSATSPEIASETGYGSFRALVDTKTAFPVWIEYTDPDGDPLKIVEVPEVEPIGGAQTAMRFTAENLQTGHRTEVHFTEMRYVPELDDTIFSPEALAFGIPNVE